MELETSCPYCGEPITLVIDEGGGANQNYVEDCEVCCRPMQVEVFRDTDGFSVDVTRTDD
jgi:Cysteine-rich CPXCG